MSEKKKFKDWFIKSEENEEKNVAGVNKSPEVSANNNPIQPITSSPQPPQTLQAPYQQPTNQQTSVQPDEAMINMLVEDLNRADRPGPDLREVMIEANRLTRIKDQVVRFEQAIDNINDDFKDKPGSRQVTKTNLLDDVAYYKNVMEEHRKEGLASLNESYETEIKNEKSKVEAAENAITSIKTQIQQLQEKLQKEEENKQIAENNITEAAGKRNSKEATFNASVNYVINTYLSQTEELIKKTSIN